MSTIFKLLVLSAALGLLYRLISVQFNPVALVDAMTGPRFAVPWARGRLGNWTALLSELELMLYLIPPLFAVIWTRRNQLSGTQVGIAAFLFLFTLFSGFCSGTRNVFAVYLSTFVVSYALSSYRRSIKSLIIISVAATGILIVASYFMLEFRRSGLQHYLSNESYHDDSARDTLFIDYNLLAISELTTVFPQNHDFIGLELPISALARPVPRALWPGKPEGLSITIEDALGAEGFTVATTFIGESYMAGGTFGVVLAALFFASLASWWNRFCTAASSSAIVSVIYASGFFALAISMRSLLMFTTAILPTIALMVLTSMFTPSSTTRRNRKPANLPSHRAAEISRTQR